MSIGLRNRVSRLEAGSVSSQREAPLVIFLEPAGVDAVEASFRGYLVCGSGGPREVYEGRSKELVESELEAVARTRGVVLLASQL